jgi:CBS domain-containing membrane protein
MLVRDYMSTQVFTIRNDKMLVAAREIMNWAHVRHVPVVDPSGTVVGIISHRDLLHAAISSATGVSEVERTRHLWKVPIEPIMRTEVQTIGPDDSVHKAAMLMRRSKIGCLPVVADGKMVGIITEHDLLGIVEKL